MSHLPKILSNFNITQLNEMQESMLKAVSQENNIVLISPTGSGKTLGFLIPTLAEIQSDLNQVQILIIVPGRELAIQIEQVFKQMKTVYKINCCYGGHSIKIEENNLLHPPTILVGTPGRIAHHIRAKKLNTDSIHTIILDEFDKSLEFGFQDEMNEILKNCKSIKKRILTSATSLKDIPDFVKLTNPKTLNFLKEESEINKSTLTIKSVRVKGDDKLEALMLLLGKINAKSTLIFCNHRDAVDRISEQLNQYHIPHGFYHGGLEQLDREKTLIKLRNESIPILVTTDLAARGLDIPEIEAVIHYQLPNTEDTMIHRNGRTARMNARGTVYYILDTDDHLPKFIGTRPIEETLPNKLTLPKTSDWETLYIAAGKKDKINKMDIVGMLLQKGNLEKDELGKIEVLDHSAYAAVKRNKIHQTLKLVQQEKIKNRKYKIEISN